MEDKGRVKVILDCIEKSMQILGKLSCSERLSRFNETMWQVDRYLRRAHAEARELILEEEYT